MDKPKRRVRYKGTHPRKFQEKYKELHPELYPEEIQKAKQAGKTPAGSHRPICLDEILEILDPKPGQSAVDATLGYGGHGAEILKKISPGGKLLGFDLDNQELPKTTARLQALGFGPDVFTPCASNFSQIPQVLASTGMSKVHLVLADLGVSSMQLDNPERGFSYKLDGPLDLRLGAEVGMSAVELLATLTVESLKQILIENADEVYADIIAKTIIKNQKKKPITTTNQLTLIIQEALSTLNQKELKEVGNKPIRRVFQALRIAVNNEFESLDQFLSNLPKILRAGGKVAVLTFHSGEDRRVKKAFQAFHRSGVFLDVAREVIRPSAQEIFSNPRASSAKLRWAIKA